MSMTTIVVLCSVDIEINYLFYSKLNIMLCAEVQRGYEEYRNIVTSSYEFSPYARKVISWPVVQ